MERCKGCVCVFLCMEGRGGEGGEGGDRMGAFSVYLPY